MQTLANTFHQWRRKIVSLTAGVFGICKFYEDNIFASNAGNYNSTKELPMAKHSSLFHRAVSVTKTNKFNQSDTWTTPLDI
jgi:hypothetical protein